MLEELATDDGVLLRRDLLAAGLDDRWILRQRRRGGIVRIRQGAYALTERWTAAYDARRHLMLVSAVMRQYGDDVAASHVSACLLDGAPSWGLPLADVHVTHLDGTIERNGASVRHHRGDCRVGDIARRNGHWVTAPERTAMDTASIVGRDPAVAVLDWYLHQGLVTPEGLDHRLRSGMKSWPNSLHLYRVIQLADGRSESVGETRTRLMLHDHGIPEPVLQYVVRGPAGEVAGRVDFAWPELGVILEFDGAQKYLALRRPGESVEEAVLREKAREDLLRELTGFRVIRITWADLEHPERTVERIRRALALGRVA
ncbi:type IV toxin-antitoxin system AbiEi family antitoxin domain-containing protein [Nocardioides dongkuii]|uniref:type IV toxin-antitoxin system AbiEi family antitoxin domain-containing protein n=1 Tax=Nocardioides dongkuii TaxID=2760089 RepID=UPI0015F9ED30|nr:hypothetical protein [Nocardioides dongkuii]